MLFQISPRVAVVRLFSVAFCGSLIANADASTSEKTHRYFRFTPTRLRDSPLPNSVQLSEFRLRLRGATIDMSKATVTNPNGSSPAAEGPAKLVDGLTTTKWLDLNKGSVVFEFPAAVTIDAYSFSTANDAQERDPGNWRLEGGDGTNWTLLDEAINRTVPTARGASTAEFILPSTVPPYTSFWHPEYLLKWTPGDDTASDFNRASIPLATRTSNTALKVNANARANEGKVTMLTTFGATSYLSAQGSATEHFNAYTGWQYTDQLVFWGGSAGEGIILAPLAPAVDAAHRNGVPVLGNVFFPPAVYGGQYHWVQTFIRKNGATFPVADKLIEIARYYGFDGWFLNQETAGGNAADATALRDFISYFRAQAPELRIMWYDAMTRGGSVTWQNSLTAENEMFVKNGTQPVAHSMFLNFWWNANALANSRSRALSLGVSPYAIYAGVDVEGGGTNTTVDWAAVFPAGQAHRHSIAFYGGQWLFNNANGPAAFQANEQRFWSGQNGDPSNTTTTSEWKGLANYIPSMTPLQTLPFVTNFNRGQGNRFVVDGTTLMTTGWNNLSLQDVLPTWRWIVTSTGTKLTPNLELDDAYSGGTSLKVSGKLDAPNDLKLYEANLPVTAATRFRMVYRTNQGTGATSMKVALSFNDAPLQPVYFNVGAAGGTGWRTIEFDLRAHAGKRIASIGLRFENAATIGDYQVRIGRISVTDGPVSTPAAVTDPQVIQREALDASSLALRLKWNPSTTEGIYYYQVIQRFPDNTRKWLGATPATDISLLNVRRKNQEDNVTLEIQAVGADFGLSPVTTVNTVLPVLPDTTRRLTGTWLGTPGSWSNQGDVGANAFDGNTSTFFDAQESSAWTGLDFGAGREKRITAFRFYPRNGWAFRMISEGVFEAANQADFSDAVFLHRVAVEPTSGVYTTVAVDRPERFRYFRFRSTGHGNVAEIDVYGYDLPATPAGLSASLTAAGSSLSWTAATQATGYRVERAASAAGPFTAIGEITVATNFNDPTVPYGQRPFYRVVSVNPAGDSTASGIVQATATGYFAWQLDAFEAETSEAIVASSSDPDQDLIVNLMEYALGLDPKVKNALTFSPQRTGDRMTIRYPKNDAATDVTLKAQWSTDLKTWTDTGVTYDPPVEESGRQMIQATAPADSTGRQFMRLQAVVPEN